MRPQKRLLTLIEQGGYPDFSVLYQCLGFEVIACTSLRKALPLIRKLQPTVIVAEFIYSPTYGSQLSNFESLYAAMQASTAETQLVALLQAADLDNLKRVDGKIAPHACLFYPVSEADMQTCLERLLSTTNL